MKLSNQWDKEKEVDTNWVIYNLKQILDQKADFCASYAASTLFVSFGQEIFLLQISNCNIYPRFSQGATTFSYLLPDRIVRKKEE